MPGLYLHIPFCRRACHYCDFHFSTSLGRKTELLTALQRETRLRAGFFGAGPRPVLSSVYFGGGTPSLLTADELATLFAAIEAEFSLVPDAEITLEANPDDLTPAWLAAVRAATPINRLSIGIQSFHQPYLQQMNRAHSAEEALRCVDAARVAGFTNFSIDLIYGIPPAVPGDHAVWRRDLETALALAPPHLSAYALTVEPDTALGRWTATGRFRPAPDEFTAEQFELLTATLTSAGYQHYEVSNFALPGREARHNSAYWAGDAYLGLGPSAHSFDGGFQRSANVASNAAYIAALQHDELPLTVENLTPLNRAHEVLMTTLRTTAGCNLTHLREQFGYDLQATHRQELAELTTSSLAEISPESVLRLTPAGRLLADGITLRLL